MNNMNNMATTTWPQQTVPVLLMLLSSFGVLFGILLMFFWYSFWCSFGILLVFVDASVPSTHDQVTHDACTLVSTGGNLEILEILESWKAGKLESWKCF